MDNNTKFKDLSAPELRALKDKAIKQPLSEFAQFCQDIGSQKNFVSQKGRNLDKWELFDMKFRNVEKLLSGNYPVKVVQKVK